MDYHDHFTIHPVKMSNTASVPTELAEEMFGHGPPPPEEIQVPVAQFKLGEDRHNTIIHWESNLGSLIRTLVDAQTLVNSPAILDKISPIEHDKDWKKRVEAAWLAILDTVEGLLDEQDGLPAIRDRTKTILAVLGGKSVKEAIDEANNKQPEKAIRGFSYEPDVVESDSEDDDEEN